MFPFYADVTIFTRARTSSLWKKVCSKVPEWNELKGPTRIAPSYFFFAPSVRHEHAFPSPTFAQRGLLCKPPRSCFCFGLIKQYGSTGCTVWLICAQRRIRDDKVRLFEQLWGTYARSVWGMFCAHACCIVRPMCYVSGLLTLVGIFLCAYVRLEYPVGSFGIFWMLTSNVLTLRASVSPIV